MSHKLDCTEKAYEIMMKHTHWRKPKRMTPKRQKQLMHHGLDGKYIEML